MLDFFLAVEVVEGAGRFDEFDQAVAILLDELFFQFQDIGVDERLLSVFAGFEKRFDGSDARAGELRRQLRGAAGIGG